jgi:hypothetical protein
MALGFDNCDRQNSLLVIRTQSLSGHSAHDVPYSSQVVFASVTILRRKVDVNTPETIAADALELNDIGEVEIETHKPVFCDPYVQNRFMGSFILIDPMENSTIAAGTILKPVIDKPDVSTNGAGQRATSPRTPSSQARTAWLIVVLPAELRPVNHVKGLYRKARSGLLPQFTGLDDPYEPPLAPEIECRTDKETLPESVDRVIQYLDNHLSHRTCTARAIADPV